MRRGRTWKIAAIGLALVMALTAAACGDDDGDSGDGDGGDGEQRTLELYSGRDEELVGPLVDVAKRSAPVARSI